MPGRHQHHIPRQFLRGFATKDGAKAMQLYVARACGRIYKSSVDNIGAGRDFYSDPAAPGIVTLDDAIRRYEDRLQQLLHLLRSQHIGDIVDPHIASEVIAHLVPRSSSLRDIAKVGITKLLEGAEQLTIPENVTKLLELDRPAPNELVSKQLSEALRAHVGTKQSPIPIDVVERMLYSFLQENGEDLAKSGFPEIASFLNTFRSAVPNMIRHVHQKVLTENLVQPARREQLSNFHWELAAAPEEGAILPDCVAIAFEADSAEASPLMGADMGSVTTVVMPLTAQTLLVGRRQSVEQVDMGDYNASAAACSSAFLR
jgi:hypothetical protein